MGTLTFEVVTPEEISNLDFKDRSKYGDIITALYAQPVGGGLRIPVPSDKNPKTFRNLISQAINTARKETEIGVTLKMIERVLIIKRTA